MTYTISKWKIKYFSKNGIYTYMWQRCKEFEFDFNIEETVQTCRVLCLDEELLHRPSLSYDEIYIKIFQTSISVLFIDYILMNNFFNFMDCELILKDYCKVQPTVAEFNFARIYQRFIIQAFCVNGWIPYSTEVYWKCNRIRL